MKSIIQLIDGVYLETTETVEQIEDKIYKTPMVWKKHNFINVYIETMWCSKGRDKIEGYMKINYNKILFFY